MNIDCITHIILCMAQKRNLTEYEMLMYEQACRLMEEYLREIRSGLNTPAD